MCCHNSTFHLIKLTNFPFVNTDLYRCILQCKVYYFIGRGLNDVELFTGRVSKILLYQNLWTMKFYEIQDCFLLTPIKNLSKIINGVKHIYLPLNIQVGQFLELIPPLTGFILIAITNKLI